MFASFLRDITFIHTIDNNEGMDIHQIRKANLKTVIKDHFGGVKKHLAEKCGWQPIVISTLSSDKPTSFKPMGSNRARAIEDAAGLPNGWMDKQQEKEIGIPLLNRKNVALFLEGETFQSIKFLDGISISEKMYSEKVFAIVEDMDGMEPVINKQDRVFIKPELEIKASSNSMFWVNGIPTIGNIGISPGGMSLRFVSEAPGWEAVKVTEDDYIGRVIAIDPLWAIEQREN